MFYPGILKIRLWRTTVIFLSSFFHNFVFYYTIVQNIFEKQPDGSQKKAGKFPAFFLFLPAKK